MGMNQVDQDPLSPSKRPYSRQISLIKLKGGLSKRNTLRSEGSSHQSPEYTKKMSKSSADRSGKNNPHLDRSMSTPTKLTKIENGIDNESDQNFTELSKQAVKGSRINRGNS